MANEQQPIGVFDSGYGGLTVLRDIVKLLPQYDYLYLGDNARAPYGSRSYETVYQYTLEAVKWFFSQGCKLVILACNTASAKALRTIQQHDLEGLGADKKVLGVIRPTAEIVGDLTVSGHVGVLGTTGTVESGSYLLEIEKFFPGTVVNQQACPMWVPLIENGEMNSDGARYFLRKDLGELLLKDSRIDTILLACTHYPLVAEQLKAMLPEKISLISQGNIVALSLKDYLKRHPEVEERCSKKGTIEFYTTDDTVNFDKHGALFFGSPISSRHIDW